MLGQPPLASLPTHDSARMADGEILTASIQKGTKPVQLGLGVHTKNSFITICKIHPGGPVEKCQKLKIGDIILSVNGTDIENSKAKLKSLVSHVPEGKTLDITVCRPKQDYRVNHLMVPSADDGSESDVSDYGDVVSPSVMFPAITVQEKVLAFDSIIEAVKTGEISNVEKVIEKNFDHGQSVLRECPIAPLHLAIEQQNTAMVKYLIGLDVLDLGRVSDKHECDALTLAIRLNFLEGVELLIDNMKPLDTRIADENGPFQLALNLGYHQIASVLAAEVQDFGLKRELLIKWACKYGVDELVKSWWPNNFDPNSEGIQAAMSLAYAEKYREIIRFMQEKGVLIGKESSMNHPDAVFKSLTANHKEFDWSSRGLSWLNGPAWFEQHCTRITDLNLSNNPIKELPDALPWKITHLNKLTVSECPELVKLSTPSDGQILCKRLTRITISNNRRLKEISCHWFQISRLQTLDISKNKLRCLQNSMGWRCGLLEILDCSDNKLTEIPKAIHACSSLVQLDASHNKIKKLPTSWSCNLTELNLSHNDLDRTFEGVNMFLNVKDVNFSHNKLTGLSSDLVKLQQLQRLNVGYNQIEALPTPDKWKCKKLRYLNLEHNVLAKPGLHDKGATSPNRIPSFLRIGDNAAVDNHHNRKKSEPPDTGNKNNPDLILPTIYADNIRTLNLSHNNLESIPDGMWELSALEDNPAMKPVPIQMGRLQYLTTLKFDGIDPTALFPGLEKAGHKTLRAQEILEHLRKQLRQEEVFRKLKVIIMGRDGVGKTSVLRTLSGQYNLKDNPELTVLTYKWNDTTSKKKNLKTSISIDAWELTRWNDCNQLHRCFITDYSLVILVFRLDKFEVHPIKNALMQIKERAPHGTVILVGTHLDTLQTFHKSWEKRLDAIQKEIYHCSASIVGCPTIAAFVAVSIESSENINTLRNIFLETCESMVSKRMAPLSHIQIQKAVELEVSKSKPDESMAYSESDMWTLIHSATADSPLPDDNDEFLRVIQLMNECGTLLHYSEAMKPSQQFWFFMEPNWLANFILNCTFAKKNLRKINYQSARNVFASNFGGFSDEDVSEWFEHFLGVLYKFELLMPLDQNILLNPHALPAIGPEVEVSMKGPITCRVYRMLYKPHGFWKRLIARLLRKLNKHFNAIDHLLMYWAEGLVLDTGPQLLRVESLDHSALSSICPDWHDGAVVTFVTRTDPTQKLFTMVIDEVDLLVEEWFPDFDSGDERIMRYAVCPLCLYCPEKVASVNMFPLETLAAISLKAKDVACPEHDDISIPLDMLVPEILLTDINLHNLASNTNYALGNYLTRGGQAFVYKGSFNNETVATKIFLQPDSFKDALKEIESSDDTDESNAIFTPILNGYQRLRREIRFIASLDHPCIIGALGVLLEPMSPLGFVLQFAPLGNLADYMTNAREMSSGANGRFASSVAIQYKHYGCFIDRTLLYKFSWHTALALQYLHKMGIIFRDLKSENILVWSEDVEDLVNIKLTDYGISCFAGPQGNLGAEGTRGFQAPEVLSNMAYDNKADIFSFGMVLYEILSGSVPFGDIDFADDIARAVKQNRRPSLKDNMVAHDFESMKRVMDKCWVKYPKNRPSAEEVCRKFETLSFLALRNSVTIEAVNDLAKQCDFLVVEETANWPKLVETDESDHCVNKPYVRWIHTEIMKYPFMWILFPYVWLTSGHSQEKKLHIAMPQYGLALDTVPCPNAETIASCSVGNTVFLLCVNQENISIEVLCVQAKSHLPSKYVGDYKLSRVEGTGSPAAMAACKILDIKLDDDESSASNNENDGRKESRMEIMDVVPDSNVFVGLSSGTIQCYSLTNNGEKFDCEEEMWTFSNRADSIYQMKIIDNKLLVVFQGYYISCLNLAGRTSMLEIPVHEPSTTLPLISGFSSNCFWYARSTSSNIRQYRFDEGFNGIKKGLKIDLSHLSAENHPSAILSVNDLLWVAVQHGRIILLSQNHHKYLGELQMPEYADYREMNILSMRLVVDTVVCLIEYCRPTGEWRQSTASSNSSTASLKSPAPNDSSNAKRKARRLICLSTLSSASIQWHKDIWHRTHQQIDSK